MPPCSQLLVTIRSEGYTMTSDPYTIRSWVFTWGLLNAVSTWTIPGFLYAVIPNGSIRT